MTQFIVKISSVKNNFLPDFEREVKAIEFLKNEYGCDVEFEKTHDSNYDVMANLYEAVICPNCKKRIRRPSSRSNEEYKQLWKTITEDVLPRDKTFKVPCCDEIIEYGLLEFKFGAAYVMAIISLINPNPDILVNGKIKIEHLKELNTILGVKLIEL